MWHNIGLALSLLVGAVALRVFGVLGDIYLILGFIAMVWLWALMVSRFPSHRTIVAWVFSIILLSTVGAVIYDNIIAPRFGWTLSALSRARESADLNMALRTSPEMLRSRLVIAETLERTQEHMGENHRHQLEGILRTMKDPKDMTEKEYQEIISRAENVLWQEQMSQKKIEALKDRLLGNNDGKIKNDTSLRFVVSPGIPEERVIPPGVCASVFSPGDVLVEKFLLDADQVWKPIGITMPGEHKQTRTPGSSVKVKISAVNKAEKVVIKQWRDPECL